MKYFLRIEGTAEEIAREKKELERMDWEVRNFASGGRAAFVDSIIKVVPEFKVVEPKYRVKTLTELCAEFGDQVTLGGNAFGSAYVYVDKNSIKSDYLGGPYSFFNPLTPYWNSIFLTEVSE